MRLRILLTLPILCVACLATAQNVKIVGNGNVSLEDLAGSPTMVTVVLKGSGAKDANLRILTVEKDYFTYLTENDLRLSYKYEDVAEIRLQGGLVPRPEIQRPRMGRLRAEDQKVVDRAWMRTKEIFATTNDNQELRILAAVLLSLGGDEEATAYLTQLAESNDLKTCLDATEALYLTGKEIPPRLLRTGLEHGNRAIRAHTAKLAGLAQFHDATPVLTTMLQDRAAEISSPAAVALARLDNRDIIPKLIEMLGSLIQERAQAAMYSLVHLGGDDIISQLKLRMKTFESQESYRIASVLFQLEDPDGRKYLERIFNELPTLAPQAALLLAPDNYWDAIQFLRDRLARREDANEPNLLYRARNAAALLKSGEPAALAVFQELLRQDTLPQVRKLVYELIAELDDRRLFSILQSSIENIDAETAMGACTAAIALSDPEFRDRLVKVRNP
jgi:HEAT repeat protein